jgi:hypothetical protein
MAYGSHALWTIEMPISNSAEGMYTPFTYCGEKAVILGDEDVLDVKMRVN